MSCTMKSFDKKSARARGIPQRPATLLQRFASVAHSKNTLSAQSLKRPVAPAVYRPQAKTAVAQAKTPTHPIAPARYSQNVLKTEMTALSHPNQLKQVYATDKKRVAPP